MFNDLFLCIFSDFRWEEKRNRNCGQQFLQYQQNEQSQKKTQHISVSTITFNGYTQSHNIVNQIITIIGIKKIKMSSQCSQTWLRSPMSSQGSQTWIRSPMSSQGSQIWLRSPMSSQGSQSCLRTYMSSQGGQPWLRSHMSSQGSQSCLRSHMSCQGNQTWLRSPMWSQVSQT
jgi:hypothetical protein